MVHPTGGPSGDVTRDSDGRASGERDRENPNYATRDARPDQRRGVGMGDPRIGLYRVGRGREARRAGRRDHGLGTRPGAALEDEVRAAGGGPEATLGGLLLAEPAAAE